jgi:trimeric autotransporter adhesin
MKKITFTLTLFLILTALSLNAQNPFLIGDKMATTDSVLTNSIGSYVWPGLWQPVVAGTSMYYSLPSLDYFGFIWNSNGSNSGTYELKNNPSYKIGVSNGTVYFTGKDAANGWQLWKSNGTSNGTAMLKKLHRSGDWYNDEYTYCNNTTFFHSHNTDDNGNNWDIDVCYELWKTDGTSNGTAKVFTFEYGCQYLTNFNNTLIFMAHDGTGRNKHAHEPWKSDGTSRGTTLIKDIYPGPTNCREPNIPLNSGEGTTYGNFGYYLFKEGNYVYFPANDRTNGLELWRTDGTTNGTIRLTNINADSLGDSYCYNPTVMGNYIYFAASDGVTGIELWRYSISSGETEKVKEIVYGASSSYPMFLTKVTTSNGDRLFFIANNDTSGYELWISDGSEAGTYMVKDINTNGSSCINARAFPFPTTISYPWNSTEWWKKTLKFDVIGSKVFFRAYTPDNGMELWESDGTEAGTVMVKDIYSGSESSIPRYLTVVDGHLLFLAYTTTYGWEWYNYDPSQPKEKAPALDELVVSTGNYSINIYPNPTDDQINISADFGVKTDVAVRIIDLLGRELFSFKRPGISALEERVDVGNILPGMYIIEFSFGNEFLQRKIIRL